MSDTNETPPASVTRRTALKLTAAGFVAAGAGSAAAESPSELQATAEEQAAEDGDGEPGDQVVVDEALTTVDALDEQYYQASVLDTGQLTTRDVWLDEDGEPVESDQVRQRARDAYEAEHGALSRSLASRLEDPERDDDRIEISVWTDDVDHGAARRAAAQAVDAPGRQENGPDRSGDAPGRSTDGRPASEVGVPEHAKELRQAQRAEVQDRIDGQTTSLGRRIRAISGAEVLSEGDGVPSVKARATPEAIEQIESLPTVWKVFERERMQPTEFLDDATTAHGTFDGRNAEFDGDGHKVGVHEPFSLVPDEVQDDSGLTVDSNVDLAAHHPDVGDVNVGGHAWLVAMSAASTDDSLPGLAKGADVYSSAVVTEDGTELSLDDVLPWYVDNDVPVVNNSWGLVDGVIGYQTDRYVSDFDLERDAQIASRGIQLVNSSGNVTGSQQTTRYVTTGARGFNTLTVGGIHEGSDASDRSQEEHAVAMDNEPQNFGGSWVNPLSEADAEFHKPEVAADATQIDFPEPAGTQADGTSFSAPMVSGLVSLLGKFAEDDADDHPLVHEPEVSKAIVMAAADANGQYDPQATGAGTIRGPNAREIVQNGWYLPATYDEADDSVTHTVQAEAGETLTMVLNWLSLPEGASWSDPANARADVNLDLVVSHDGDVVATSTNPVRANQWVRFQAPATGSYTVTVSKADWEHDTDDSREYCLAWHRDVDDAAPTAVPQLHVYDRSPTTLGLHWDHAGDAGGSGVETYEIELTAASGATTTHTVDAPVNEATVRELSPGTDYTVAVRAIDRAGNSSPDTSVQTSTHPAPLLVNDFDGSANYPQTNELGEDIVPYGFDDDGVQDGVLRLDYSDTAAAYATHVDRDVAEYSQLSVRVRGDTGGEHEHFTVEIQGQDDDDSTPLEPVDDEQITTEFRRIAYDLEGLDQHLSSLDIVLLNWFGTDHPAGAIEVDQITLEGRDGVEPLLFSPFQEDPPQNRVAGGSLDNFFGNASYRDDGLYELEAGGTAGGGKERGYLFAEWAVGRDLTPYDALQMVVENDGVPDLFRLTSSSVDLARSKLPTEPTRVEWPLDVFKEHGDPVESIQLDPSVYGIKPGDSIAFDDVRFVGPDPLLINDYDGSANWPNENDLGSYVATSGVNASVVDGAVRVEYDGTGVYEEGVERDISGHDELHLRIRGDDGGEESELRLWIGGSAIPMTDLTADTVETHFTTLRLSLDAFDEDDLENAGSVSVYSTGGSGPGAVEIDEIALYGDREDPKRPLVGIEQPDDIPDLIELGDTYEFDAAVAHTDAPIESYEWFVGPLMPTADQTVSTYTGETINHTFDQVGTVGATLRVDDADGISGYYQFDWWGVDESPTAAFEITSADASPAPGDAVTFDASASDPGVDDSIVSYEWAFGDGTTATGEIVDHAFDSEGEYDVTLTVTDEFDLTDSTTQTVVCEVPHGEISPTTTSASVGDTVGFDIDTNTDWLTAREWDMDDGTTYSGDWHVSHSFDSAGQYVVTLETESGHDGSRTDDAVVIDVS